MHGAICSDANAPPHHHRRLVSRRDHGGVAENLCRLVARSRLAAARHHDLSIPTTFATLWQRERLAEESIAKQLSYWKNKLSGYRRLEVPADLPRPAQRTTNGAIVSALLPRKLTDALKEFSNEQGGTIFITTLAACMALLRRYTCENDIAIGSPFAGRGSPETDRLIGLFINQIVFRVDASGDPLFPELVLRVREAAWEAFANQEVPFENVLKEVCPTEDPYRNPFYAINFICQREYARASTFVFEFAESSMSTMPSKSQGAVYDLNFFAGRTRIAWTYIPRIQHGPLSRKHRATDSPPFSGIACRYPGESQQTFVLEFTLSGDAVLPRESSLDFDAIVHRRRSNAVFTWCRSCAGICRSRKICAPRRSLPQKRFWSLEGIESRVTPRFHMACVRGR